MTNLHKNGHLQLASNVNIILTPLAVSPENLETLVRKVSTLKQSAHIHLL